MKVIDIIIKAGFAKSKTQARNLIKNKGIKLGSTLITDCEAELFLYEKEWILIQSEIIEK